MTDAQRRAAAKEFSAQWAGKGYEKGQSQAFWLSLLRDVYGVEHPETFITFEDQVALDHTSFIDGFIPATHVLIEQKSLGKDLNKAIRQSDGTLLSPFQQAKRYSAELPYSQRPRWIVTCNFAQFYVYDMERPTGEPEIIELKDLEREHYRLQFLVDTGDSNIHKEMEVSLEAGRIVGVLYDALLAQYKDPDSEETLRHLNALCVRLVFCLYAEDAGIFGPRNMFHNYLQHHTADARRALLDLFEVLNTKPEDRDPYLEEDLAAFPYVNGGLFAEKSVIPRLDEAIVDLILHKASADFDWSVISPTIFGAVFESTLNPDTRRKGGMHYTSIENIHKVIDPLFLDDLRDELTQIQDIAVEKTRMAKLKAFQAKLAGLTFLDPACGSGNFLTETYLSLRRLENEVIGALHHDQITLDMDTPIQVSIHQFYGIEINDFAVTVARTALWIAESQMMKETEDVVHMSLDFLPLKTNASIVEGNALRLDWESVVSKDKLDYIMGNPPFVGARIMSKEQKDDLIKVFGTKWKNIGNMDYVSGWYKKAVDYMRDTNMRTALVSTNSITQGEQVANLWKPLISQFGTHIDFAYRTFRWDSEAYEQAHVHCVIIGFSETENPNNKHRLFDGDKEQEVEHINAYLIPAPDIFVGSRNKPLCDIPGIGIGNKPIDGGNYLFTEEEMHDFIKLEPDAVRYFHPWYGAQEFINRQPRYCLWLGDCSPAELRRMPHCLKRVEAVRQLRLASKSEGTVKLADRPTRFHVENMPKTNSKPTSPDMSTS